jgi:hypothetical protein
MTSDVHDLAGAYDAIARKSMLFRMSAGLVRLRPWAQTPDQTAEWLERTSGEFGITVRPPSKKKVALPLPSVPLFTPQALPLPPPPPSSLDEQLPTGMPKKQRAARGWKRLLLHESRLKLFNDTLAGMEDEAHKALLRMELPNIWARSLAENRRKWLFFHPSLSREVVLKVFEIHNDRTVSVRRGDGLVESMDNLVFGLLLFHGVPYDHWPGRRKGSKRKATQSTA